MRDPAFAIAVKLNYPQALRFYYPESECKNVEEFIDNLNTDFGMTQIRIGPKSASLRIVHYDLVKDTITFKIGHGNTLVTK